MSTFKPEVIKIDDMEVQLKKEKLTDIFHFDSPPYVCIAVTGGGKTTLAIDLIYTFAAECSNVYYVTKTTSSFTDNTIDKVPKAFIRAPTYENISAIWEEMNLMYAATNVKKEKMIEIVIKLYGENIAHELVDKVEQQTKVIINRNCEMYKKAGYSQNEISKLIDEDLKAFRYELYRRVILYGIKDVKNQKELDEKLNVEQTNIINGLVSKPTKTLLIFDDMTSEINNMKMDKTKIIYQDPTSKQTMMLTKSQAYDAMVFDILSTGRHHNAIIVFFVHSFDTIEKKDAITNVILFDDQMVTKLMGLRLFPKNMKKIVASGASKVFRNTEDHNFLHYDFSKRKLSVGRADLHTIDDIKVSPQMQQYFDIFEKINSGFVSTDTTKDNKEETDNEDAEEDFEGII